MPTKAELERQVKSLKLQLANALAETRGTVDEGAEATKLRQCNEHLRSLLNKLQTRLERERSVRQEAELALLEKQHLLVELEQERSHGVTLATEHTRYTREMAAQRELIGMLERQVNTLTNSTMDASAGQINNEPPPSNNSRGLDTHAESAHGFSLINVHHDNELASERNTHQLQHTQLPPLPLFDGKVQESSDAYDRWSRKLRCYAELQQWSERDTLLQFELHLTGRAEELYDVLPEDVKQSSESAISALGDRLHPIRRDALASAQLIRRKQEPKETVDLYAHAFEQLFEKSYGRNQGMDAASKAILKRDLFVQGLLICWQEKVIPSVDTFEDALYQARLAEQQQLDLTHLHKQPSRYLMPQARQGARYTNTPTNPNQTPRST